VIFLLVIPQSLSGKPMHLSEPSSFFTGTVHLK